MPAKSMVGQEDRPDLTVNTEKTEGAAGGSPRNLDEVLGTSTAAAQKTVEHKQVPEKVTLKDTLKDSLKDHKDTKDIKEQKDHKDPKEHKDQKDTKDHKDPKEHKDQKDQKDSKEHKDQKDTKDHKDPKEHKDLKDVKEHKEVVKENIKEHGKEIFETVPQPPVIPDPAPDDLSSLINRVSGLEKTVGEMKK